MARGYGDCGYFFFEDQGCPQGIGALQKKGMVYMPQSLESMQLRRESEGMEDASTEPALLVIAGGHSKHAGLPAVFHRLMRIQYIQ